MRALAMILGLSIMWATPVVAQEGEGETEAAAAIESATATARATATERATATATAPESPTATAPESPTASAPATETATAPEAEPEVGAEELEEDPDPPPGWTDEKAAGWAVFIASVGVGVGGAVLLASGVDDLNSVENASAGSSWSSVEEAYERAPLLTGFGAAVLGLGAVGTFVGAGLLAAFGDEGTWMRVSFGPGHVRLSGRF